MRLLLILALHEANVERTLKTLDSRYFWKLKLMTFVKSLKAKPIAYCLLLVFSVMSETVSAQSKSSPADSDQLPEVSPAVDRLNLPSISATHTKLHEPSGVQVMRAFIEISPQGLRVKDTETGGVYEMLQDFVGENGWLLDHKRSIFHRVPVVEMPELGAASPGQAASFLGPHPCGNLQAVAQGAGRWRGRAVNAFDCVDNSSTVITVEFVDQIYGIVVYLQTVDGYIDELSSMSGRDFSDSHFLPPEDYREVEKSEFFFGAPQLAPYLPPEK